MIRQRYAGLAQAAESVASPQLRNQGNSGGNLCQRPRCWYFRGDFPCAKKGGAQCFAVNGDNRYHCIFGGSVCVIVHPSDTAPALISLGAQVKIDGPGGERTIPLESFYILPEDDHERETVLEPERSSPKLSCPRSKAGRSSYRKARERGTWDFALASVALAIREEGGVRPRSSRRLWRRSSQTLAIGARREGNHRQENRRGRARRAAEAAVKEAEPLDYNEYKIPLLQGLVEESLLAI